MIVRLARSVLLHGLDKSLRVQDLEEIKKILRAPAIPDGTSGLRVLTKSARLAGGTEVEVVSPAFGILGDYAWEPEHTSWCVAMGTPFPSFVKLHGSGGDLRLAQGFRAPTERGYLGGDEIRDVLGQLLRLPPLALTAEEVAALRIKGHT